VKACISAMLRAMLVAALSIVCVEPGGATQAPAPPLPGRLSDTGLYVEGSISRVQPHVLAFTPQYPLWSDAATKRRWVRLPPGTAIDASEPDAWKFPRGTRIWKEFSHERRVETRYIERLADGTWRYATYVWTPDGSDALLAPERGSELMLVPTARAYRVPSRDDCRACHEGAAFVRSRSTRTAPRISSRR
jgi:hypothetical protein